ncbi:unnamed protein product, partial [marine sediment metagenome]
TNIVREVGKQAEIPVVATPDAHYCRREDAIDQRVLLCVGLSTTMSEVTKRLAQNGDVALGQFFKSSNYHIPTYDEMTLAGHTQTELENTLLIAEMCEEYNLRHTPMMPNFSCPNKLSSREYITQLCKEGWGESVDKIDLVVDNSDHTKDEYGERFQEEFATLDEANLHNYFLIIYDIMEFAKRNNIYRGAGRGSVGGSLIAYLLGITEVDPIEYGLLFSRFYNKGRNTADRVSLPDIDLDFEMGGREKIVAYIREKYGIENVAQMITFNRMQGRSALKDVLRTWSSCSFSEMNDMTQFIPNESEISDQLQLMKDADKERGGEGKASIIMWALENNAKELKEWAYIDEESGRIQGPLAKRFEQAIRMEGTKRSTGKHAAGVIVGNSPLKEICPLVYDTVSKTQIGGWEMDDLESVGLVKLDLLGLGLLDRLHGIVDLLGEN